MALSILDGNQSATTLSTIVTSGQHIPAHTVVSIGTQAITDISGAISGSTVCVGNLGLLQSTVATEGLSASGSFIKIGGHTGTSTTGNIVHVSSVGALRVDGSVYTQPVSIASVTIGNTVTIAGTVTANPTGTQTIAGTVTANGGDFASQPLGAYPSKALRIGFADDENYYAVGLAGGGNPLPVILYNTSQDAIGSSEAGSVPLVISGTVTIGSALPAGTNRIGVVTIGAGTVTIGAGISQIGSVTASISGTVPISISSVTVGNSLTIGSLPALVAGTAQIGSVTASISNSVTIASFATSVTARLINPAGTAVTYAEVGTAGNPSIDVLSVQGVTSGTPLTILNHQGTTVTTSNFTSTTASTVLASANTSREVLTIFNEGAGNLHICAGATCTTIAYQVRLSAGDYYEVPLNQTSLTHSAVFATAGTARIVQIS